ncbi:MAG: 4'-phosphopantetheinyl transferase family protein [Nodosilinea sp.]
MAATVQVWVILTRDPEFSCLDQLLAYLSPAERHRSDSIRHALTQRNFLVGRGCLRYLLGRYLGQPPASLSFTYGPQGKPGLGQGNGGLEFNLSHSGDYVAIAIADRRVGIDLEQVRTLNALPALCERCLSPGEQINLLTLSQPQAHLQFFRYWTAKEAYLKGVGVGLSQPMGNLEVMLDQQPLFQYPKPLTQGLGILPGWQIWQWQVDSDHVAALACALAPKTTLAVPQVRRLTVAAVLAAADAGPA